MRRKFFSTLTLTLLVLTFAVPATVSATRCYEEVRKQVNGQYSSSDTYVSQAPGTAATDCKYAEMQEAGYDVTGLPNSFPSGNGTCFYFPINGAGQTVNCSDPTYANAPAYGTQPDGSSNTAPSSGGKGTFNTGAPTVSADECGENGVKISIDIGCRGQGNPIVDMLFAFIRFLSIGVGLVIVASIIVAGIQYTTSQGDPNATAKALGRVSSSAIALLIYIFAAALLNFVIPAGIFR